MKLTTDEQIARFLATEVMGFAVAKNDDGKDWYCWPERQEWECRVADWTPCSDLNQAFMMLVKSGSYWITSLYVQTSQGDMDRAYHDNTPASIARAICVALCRAHGLEVDE